MSAIKQSEFYRVRYFFHEERWILNIQSKEIEVHESELSVVALRIAHLEPRAYRLKVQRRSRKVVIVENERFEKVEALEDWMTCYIGKSHTVEEARKRFDRFETQYPLSRHVDGYCDGMNILERQDGEWIAIPPGSQVFTIREVESELA